MRNNKLPKKKKSLRTCSPHGSESQRRVETAISVERAIELAKTDRRSSWTKMAAGTRNYSE